MLMMVLALSAILTAQPPVPQPFPQPSGSAPSPARQAPAVPAPKAPATPPAQAAVQPAGEPTETTLGVPIYPGAQFITSYDAGRGQRYYVFGSTASYGDLVAYYRNVLRQKGDEVFDVPATYEFDIDKFREDTMAFPPSVTIKDFQSAVSQGYPNPKPAAQPAYFPSIIQIVPSRPGS
ncbi:MAG: hypothetical protein ACM3SQ_06315 [Betaproteobacteria bacterium]